MSPNLWDLPELRDGRRGGDMETRLHSFWEDTITLGSGQIIPTIEACLESFCCVVWFVHCDCTKLWTLAIGLTGFFLPAILSQRYEQEWTLMWCDGNFRLYVKHNGWFPWFESKKYLAIKVNQTFPTPLLRHPQEPQGCQIFHKNILKIDLMSY